MKIYVIGLCRMLLGGFSIAQEFVEPTDLRHEVASTAGELIRKYEGVRYTAYRDQKQRAIGYGTTSYQGETITPDEARARFEQELLPRVDRVISENDGDINQLSALVSLLYNCPSCYRSISKNTTKSNWLAHDKVCKKIDGLQQCKALKGLTKRRQEEWKIYSQSALYETPLDIGIEEPVKTHKKECTRIGNVDSNQYIQYDSWIGELLSIFRPKEKTKIFICDNLQ